MLDRVGRHVPRHQSRPGDAGAARSGDLLVAVRRGQHAAAVGRSREDDRGDGRRLPAGAHDAHRRHARAHPLPPTGVEGVHAEGDRRTRTRDPIDHHSVDRLVDRQRSHRVRRAVRRATARRGDRPRPQRARFAPGRLQAMVRRLDRRDRDQHHPRAAARSRTRCQRVPALLRRGARSSQDRAAGRPADRAPERPHRRRRSRGRPTNASSTCPRC